MRKYKINRLAKSLQLTHGLPHLSAHHFATTASTNTLLLHGNDGINNMHTGANLGSPSPYTIVSADTQTAGHGRSGRSWASSKGNGVYVSISLPPFQPHLHPSPMARLNIFAGYRLCENLRQIGTPAYLKWPNDIIVHNKKIGGMLLESTYQNNTTTAMVLGVGLNVNQTSKHLAHLPQSTSIRLATKRKYNIYQAYKIVATSILEAYNLANKNNPQTVDMVKMWSRYSQNLGKEIMFYAGNDNQNIDGKISVVEQGITDEGYIITKDNNGNQHTYTYGEVGYSTLK